MAKNPVNKIILGDVEEVLRKIGDNSVDMVLTDPPYFLDKMDNGWSHKVVSNKSNQQTVKSLPAGMKFDREQGRRFYKWYFRVSEELHRVLKPGGFFFSFSSPRLYHRMACAVDDAGFDIRDCFIWLYTQNQPKAMSLDHFIKKLNISAAQKKQIMEKLDGWKTPQLKSCFEPIVMAQKQYDKTFLNNMLRHNVGLANTVNCTGDNMFPSNVLSADYINEVIDKYFLVSKPSKKEKGEDNSHKTVKPVSICEQLIKLFTFSKDSIVLDPFVGSGTTMVAANKLGRKYIGIDLNPEYVDIAKQRLAKTKSSGAEKKTTGFGAALLLKS